SLTMTAAQDYSTQSARSARPNEDVLARINDFNFPPGWSPADTASARGRKCCEALEDGQILSFDGAPFPFSQEDRGFLLSQRQSGSRLHKNVSYRPKQNILRGAAGDGEDVNHLRDVMKRYSE